MPSAAHAGDYAWTRFWCPRDGKITLEDGGYVVDPQSEYGPVLNPDLTELDAVASAPCLVFLGEPGIGKSHEIVAVRAFPGEAEATDSESLRGALVRFDLRDYDSTADVSAHVFGAPEVVAWRDGVGHLTLVLDSLDEALVEIGPLATRLATEFARLPRERLAVRIACRTADFPPVLEAELRRLWPAENAVRILELAPLRARDVRDAAALTLGGGAAAAAFMAAVEARGAAPLAAKPVTLTFLLASFAEFQEFPATQAALYEAGCRQLVEEQNPSRRASGRAGSLGVTHRLAIAGRIAAATVFANRAAVWTGSALAAGAADITPDDLTGWELVGGERVRVSAADVAEVLGTGLFTSRGPERLGWAHYTYAEFLAARWVWHHQLPAAQVVALLAHPDEPDGSVVPQLHEAASWLAGVRGDVLRYVASREPLLLLWSDVQHATDDERAAVTAALLAVAESGTLRRPPFGARVPYERLAHPGLAAQLAPVIADRTRPEFAREIACRIAEACNVAAVADVAATVALDATERPSFRADAVNVVAAVGTQDTRRRLLPLAVSVLPEDDDDQIKGGALSAVHDLLAADAVFGALTRPKRPSFTGAYEGFLMRLARTGRPDVLVPGLRWAAREPHTSRVGASLLAAHLVIAAFERLDEPEVLDALGEYVRACLDDYQTFPPDSMARERVVGAVTADPVRRLRVAAAVIEGAADDGESPHLWHLQRWRPLLSADDFAWAADRFVDAERDADGVRPVRWLEIAAGLFNPHEDAHATWVHAHLTDADIAGTFGPFYRAIDLDSDAARQARAQAAREAARQAQRRAREVARARPAPACAVVNVALRALGRGNTDAWLRAAGELARTADERVFPGNVADLREGALWPTLGNEERSAVLDGAVRFLDQHTPTPPDATQIIDPRTWAGYRALRLVTAASPERLAALGGAVWERWAPTLVPMRRIVGEAGEREAHAALLRRAADGAAAIYSEATQAAVDAELASGTLYYALESVREGLSGGAAARLGPALVDRCRAAVSEDGLYELLRMLLGFDVAGTQEYAESLLTTMLPDAVSRERAVAAARALLEVSADGSWTTVWDTIRRSRPFGRALTMRMAAGYVQPLKDITRRFTERAIADLYCWLVREYPHAEDPINGGAYHGGSRDYVAHWRDDLLTVLERWGTPESVLELVRIRQALPDLEWLAQPVLRAQEAQRRSTWRAPDARTILALADRADLRLVENAGQLLDVVEESLRRYETELQGELPAAPELWDQLAGGRYRPKDEGHLADAIARHLRRDLADRGIVAGREVVVRRGVLGGAPGRRTDVHVTATAHPGSQRAYPSITAVIEVKGSWHREVLTAMTTQLVGDYLSAPGGTRHGLFVVGFYTCAPWVDGPEKRQSTRYGSCDALTEELTAQARALSVGGVTVRASVLNTALPDRPAPATAKRAATKAAGTKRAASKRAGGNSGRQRSRPDRR